MAISAPPSQPVSTYPCYEDSHEVSVYDLTNLIKARQQYKTNNDPEYPSSTSSVIFNATLYEPL